MFSLFGEKTTTGTKNTFSLEAVRGVLNVIPEPTLLFDSKERKIRVGNRAMAKLSGYTQDELKGMALKVILLSATILSDLEEEQSKIFSQKGVDSFVITREKKKLKIIVQAKKVETLHSLYLLIIVPQAQNQHQGQRLLSEKRESSSSLFFDLVNAYHQPKTDNAIASILQTGKELLNAKSIAFYRVVSNHPKLYKVAALDESGYFPSALPASDFITYFFKPLFIPPYPSSVCSFHELAQKNNLSFLVSAPLQDTHTINGVVIALGNENVPPPPKASALFQMRAIATTTLNVLTHNELVTSLRQEISKISSENLIGEAINKNIPVGIIDLRIDLTIRKINPAIEIMLGYSAEEILNYPVEDVLIGTDRLLPAIHVAAAGIATPNLSGIKLHARDGSVFPATIKVIPVLYPTYNNVFSIILFVRDVSEDEKQRIKEQHLEQRALVGDMNAIFAHEIRNPINNISSGVQLLDRVFAEDSSSRKIIEGLNEDCDRLTHIVDTVLSTSKVQNPERTPINLEKLVRRILSRWRPRMQRVGIQHHLKVHPNVPLVSGERHSLEQVFINLVNNAIKAMEPTHGGVLAIHIQPAKKTHEGDSVKIDVVDTGVGIPKKIRKSIFVPFVTTKPDGTGLGLSISKQIITRHKGTISVSHLPEGTVFHIVLPAMHA